MKHRQYCHLARHYFRLDHHCDHRRRHLLRHRAGPAPIARRDQQLPALLPAEVSGRKQGFDNSPDEFR